MRGYPSWRSPNRSDDTGREVRTSHSRGYIISYEDDGAGSPIVLIPGYLMSAADWRDCGYVDRLVSNRRVITVDPLGHGLSDKPTDPAAYVYPAVAADIVAAMDDAGVDRATVWGYSRGAALAGVIATEFPGRVAALIIGGQDLTGTIGQGSPTPEWAQATLAGSWEPLWEMFEMTEEDRKHSAEHFDPRAFGAVVAGARISGFAIDLSRIKAPAFVYCGGNDDVDEDKKKTAEALGDELHLLPGLDHSDAFSPVGGADTTVRTVVPMITSFLEAAGL